MEIQEEQVQWVFGGLQASSYENAIILVIKASPSASHHIPWLLFVLPHYIYAMLDYVLGL
jgi:hypothetical protein